MTLRVGVLDGTVQCATDREGGKVDTGTDVGTLFAWIRRNMSEGAEVRAEYHPAHGYPTSVFFDRGEEGDGFELYDFVVTLDCSTPQLPPGLQ